MRSRTSSPSCATAPASDRMDPNGRVSCTVSASSRHAATATTCRGCAPDRCSDLPTAAVAARIRSAASVTTGCAITESSISAGSVASPCDPHPIPVPADTADIPASLSADKPAVHRQDHIRDSPWAQPSDRTRTAFSPNTGVHADRRGAACFRTRPSCGPGTEQPPPDDARSRGHPAQASSWRRHRAAERPVIIGIGSNRWPCSDGAAIGIPASVVADAVSAGASSDISDSANTVASVSATGVKPSVGATGADVSWEASACWWSGARPVRPAKAHSDGRIRVAAGRSPPVAAIGLSVAAGASTSAVSTAADSAGAVCATGGSTLALSAADSSAAPVNCLTLSTAPLNKSAPAEAASAITPSADEVSSPSLLITCC
jgi:hypothetical protein